MRQWWSKIARVFRKQEDLSDDLRQEMDAHLEFMIDENLERGMNAAQARATAQREFGNRTHVGEKSVESWQFGWFEELRRDGRYAARGILRAPLFSLIIVITLAVGIGANTAIFSAVYAVLLKPLPFPSGERLVWMGESTPSSSGISVTWINFKHWQQENHSFVAMAGFQGRDLTLTGHGQAVLTHAGVVTSDFFPLVGARPTLGRLFTAADNDPHAPAVAVLNADFWAKTLGADPNIVGKSITLDGQAITVIGVLGRDPGFYTRPMDYYLPLRPTPQEASQRDAHDSMRLIGLLKPGVTLAAARSDIDTIMQRLAKADPGPENDHRVFAQLLSVERTGDLKQPFYLLMAAVSLVLILACANIGGLLLIRATTRARELAIRTAIGAGRSRLVRQLLTETLLIAAIGGACGLGLAAVCLHLLQTLGPRDIPRLSEAGLNWPVLLFAAVLTLAVALVSSLAPILSTGKVSLSILIKEGTAGSGNSSAGHALRSGLVIVEIAVAVVLLFSSGMLLRSLWAAENVNPGFDPGHVLALELQLPDAHYASDGAVLDFFQRLKTALRAQPGIESVGAVNCPPAAGDCGDWWYSIVERPAPSKDDVPVTLTNIADSAYFQTMHLPILAGRGPSPQDTASSPKVVVINDVIARRWWANPRAAIGQHIKLGGPYMKGPEVQIVGVAANVPQMGLDTEPQPQLYFPVAQHVSNGMVVMMRTRGSPESMMPVARRVLANIDRDVPIQSLKTANEWLGATLARRRFITLLLALFAAIAVILAIIGCYGALNFWVNSRRQEIAIRMAMGAGTAAILARTGKQAARLGITGLLIGLAASWGASRWLGNLLFGVSVHDPLVFSAAVFFALLLVLLSAAVPLWRATQVDPIATLHEV
ncbi:MAG TPA: ABC transporter permease [Terracidiphilus sp.]|nr:ABC transporter permease [Terracidiphilus sp.]